MTDERVHFEFFYEYGKDHGFFHHGSLPRAQFESLVRGEVPPLLRIDDVSYWSAEEDRFVAPRPGGSQPSGAAYFLRDRMSRIWPVSPTPGAGVPSPADDRRPPPRLRRRLEEFFGGPLEAPRIIQEALADSDLPNLELAIADFLRREASNHELLGVLAADHFEFRPGLRRVLAQMPREQEEYLAVRVGPPEWKRLEVEMVFILTTNRPDLLEPALASRPGRIDQAVEFPLPDEASRRRLFELYSRGLPVGADLEAYVGRTEGASGAFIEELLRRALIFAAEEMSPKVLDGHIKKALDELVLAGGELTRSLLGYDGEEIRSGSGVADG